MSVKAKLEAIVYAAEEPVTLDQLAALLKQDVLAEIKAEKESALPEASQPVDNVVVVVAETAAAEPAAQFADFSAGAASEKTAGTTTHPSGLVEDEQSAGEAESNAIYAESGPVSDLNANAGAADEIAAAGVSSETASVQEPAGTMTEPAGQTASAATGEQSSDSPIQPGSESPSEHADITDQPSVTTSPEISVNIAGRVGDETSLASADVISTLAADSASSAQPAAESIPDASAAPSAETPPDGNAARVAEPISNASAACESEASASSPAEASAAMNTTASIAPLEVSRKKGAKDPELVVVRDRLRLLLDQLVTEYSSTDRGMEIRQVAGGYRMATKPEHHDVVVNFAKSLKPPIRLSLQALETLAVIAYKQPVTVPEISEIRGVDSAGVIATLLDRKLVTTAGRKAVIGRPILYKTTKEFLLRFGLKDLAELPSMEEFEKLGDPQSVLFDKEPEPEPPVNGAEGTAPASSSTGTAEQDSTEVSHENATAAAETQGNIEPQTEANVDAPQNGEQSQPEATHQQSTEGTQKEAVTEADPAWESRRWIE